MRRAHVSLSVSFSLIESKPVIFFVSPFYIIIISKFSGPIEHSDSETEETQANEDISRICYCRVDAKKLSMFLSADQISTNRTVCSIVHKKLVILCLQTDENVKLQCFISGIVY